MAYVRGQSQHHHAKRRPQDCRRLECAKVAESAGLGLCPTPQSLTDARGAYAVQAVKKYNSPQRWRRCQSQWYSPVHRHRSVVNKECHFKSRRLSRRRSTTFQRSSVLCYKSYCNSIQYRIKEGAKGAAAPGPAVLGGRNWRECKIFMCRI